jgi:hypothetical protein
MLAGVSELTAAGLTMYGLASTIGSAADVQSMQCDEWI